MQRRRFPGAPPIRSIAKAHGIGARATAPWFGPDTVATIVNTDAVSSQYVSTSWQVWLIAPKRTGEGRAGGASGS